MDHLAHPIGVVVFKNILHFTESKQNAIAFKDLTRDTIVNVDKLTVEKIKGKLADIGAWKEKLQKETKEISSRETRRSF